MCGAEVALEVAQTAVLSWGVSVIIAPDISSDRKGGRIEKRRQNTEERVEIIGGGEGRKLFSYAKLACLSSNGVAKHQHDLLYEFLRRLHVLKSQPAQFEPASSLLSQLSLLVAVSCLIESSGTSYKSAAPAVGELLTRHLLMPKALHSFTHHGQNCLLIQQDQQTHDCSSEVTNCNAFHTVSLFCG